MDKKKMNQDLKHDGVEGIVVEAGERYRRLSRRHLLGLRAGLSLPDRDLLGLLRQHRFLTSHQVAGLVHAKAASNLAGLRAGQRQLRKLHDLGLVNHLPRKVGGYGGGQAQTVWHLSEGGHRLLGLDRPDDEKADKSLRQRFREPSPQFLAHTLRVADIRLALEQLSRPERAGAADNHETDSIDLTLIQTEPVCWRTWVSTYGGSAVLRPDLYAETSDPDFDYFYFIEADMDSEHAPAIMKKARVYQTYYQTGLEQARHGGVFPLVLWVTPDERRARQILNTIRADPKCDERLHRAVTMADLPNFLSHHGEDPVAVKPP